MSENKTSKSAQRVLEHRRQEEETKRKKRNRIKYLIIGGLSALIVIAVSSVLIVKCTAFDESQYTLISYGKIINEKGTDVHDTLKALRGEKVKMTGYVSTDTNLKGKSIFLVKTNTQSCPFCKNKYGDAMPVRMRGSNSSVTINKKYIVYGTLQISNGKDNGFDTAFRIILDRIEAA